jgi:hypothetical protein
LNSESADRSSKSSSSSSVELTLPDFSTVTLYLAVAGLDLERKREFVH